MKDALLEKLKRATLHERRKIIGELSKLEKQQLFSVDYFESGKNWQISGYEHYLFRKEKDMFTEAFVELITHKYHPRRILDLGCGDGKLIYMLRSCGVDAYGVDVSYYAITNSPVRRYIAWIDVETEKLPYPNDSFDLVVSRQTMEHITHFRNVFTEVYRILSKGGFLLFDVPTPNSKAAFMDITHINIWNKKEWINIIEEYGFHYANFSEKQFFREYSKLLVDKARKADTSKFGDALPHHLLRYRLDCILRPPFSALSIPLFIHLINFLYPIYIFVFQKDD
jgi:SAM-dependent methyltransferase